MSDQPHLGIFSTGELFQELISRFQKVHPSWAVTRNLRAAKSHATLTQLAHRPVNVDWCGPDNCPIEICNGPHVDHPCAGGGIATTRIDQLPCTLCGFSSGGSA